MVKAAVYGGRRMRSGLLLAAALFAGAEAGRAAQAGRPRLPSSFDVVSIRVNNSGAHAVMLDAEKNSFTATNVTLMTMLDLAYGMKSDLVLGAPAWADSTRYDIQAKILDADGVDLEAFSDKDLQPILQTMLTERFQLKVHTETKTLPLYELVVAKGGSKLKASPATTADGQELPHDGNTTVHHGEISGHGVTMARAASLLSDAVRRTVVDKTGLTGGYDFILRWTPDEDSGKDAGAPADAPPSIFAAVQEQLGLKLQSGKGPVATLVIDHMEKPSEN
jgi:uncharacterized protein (TIGR03435 family)